MKMKILSSLVLTAMVALLAGCVSTVSGDNTAGMPLVKDKIVSRYERTVPQLVLATREVLNRNGKMLGDNTVTHAFYAQVNECKVWVKLTPVDPKVTEVAVQARTKMGGAAVDVASEVSKQIALQLTAIP